MTRRWHPAPVVVACGLLVAPLAVASAQTDDESSPTSTDGGGEQSTEDDQDAGFWNWVKQTLDPGETSPDDSNRDPGGGGGGGGDGGGSGGHN